MSENKIPVRRDPQINSVSVVFYHYHRVGLFFIPDVSCHGETGGKMLVNNSLDNHSIEACRGWLVSGTENASFLLLIWSWWVSPVTCLQCPQAQTSSRGELDTEDRHRLARGSRGTSWPPRSSPQHLDSLLQRRRSRGTHTQPGS